MLEINQDTMYLNYQLRPALAHMFHGELQYTPMHLLDEDLTFNIFKIYENGIVSRIKNKDKNDLIQECISLEKVAYSRNEDAISDLFEVVYRNYDKRPDAAKVLVNVKNISSSNISQISTQQNTLKVSEIDNYRTFVALSNDYIVQYIINKHVKLRDRL